MPVTATAERRLDRRPDFCEFVALCAKGSVILLRRGNQHCIPPGQSWSESCKTDQGRRQLPVLHEYGTLWALRRARRAAFYKSLCKAAADQLKNGNTMTLAFPDAFPNRGGLRSKWMGRCSGALAASGVASQMDEAIAQAGLDALNK